MNKKTNRQIQSEQTMQKIIEAANVCFIRKGMAYTLITDICQEAQVSVGTFYHYFKNKNDLIISQFKKFDMGFLDVAQQLIENENAMDALIQFAHFFSRDALGNKQPLTIEYLKARISLTLEQLLPKNRPYFIILCTVIYNGQVRKQLRRDLLPHQFASSIMTVTRGYNLDWASNNGSYDLKKEMERMIPILFDGYKWKEEYDQPLCPKEEAIPSQNLPELYEDETAKLRQYCVEHLL